MKHAAFEKIEQPILGKLSSLLKVAAGIGLLAISAPAMAAPFSCSGDIYQVQSGQLRIFDPLVSAYVDVGTNQGSYNATGYNINDNFAYGSQGNNVIRIHADGTAQTLYNVGFSSFAGDVDDSNGLWLRRSASQYSRVNLTDGSVATSNFTGNTVSGADAVWIRNGGIPYLVMVTTNNIGVVNLNTNVSERKSISGLPGGGFGATWSDFNGRIFTFNNGNGGIYELFNIFGASPSAVLAAQGDPSNNNDGFSCPQAPFPNLQPVAQDDVFTTPFQTAITRNVLTNNGNGVDFDPESTALLVETTPVVAPANGTVSIATDGSFTYTPNAGFYGTDSFRYRISDATGLTDTATVTITVPAPPINLVTVKTLASGNSNPIAGDTVTFNITVTNNGPAEATGVSLIDQIPTGLTPTANNGNVTVGSYVAGSGVWTIGTLANGASATLTIEGIIDGSSAGQPLENVTTKAVGDQVDPTDNGNDLMEGIVIFPLTLSANSDSSDDIVSSVGNANALNVFDGDTLGNNPVVPGDMTLSVAAGSSLPSELTFDTTSGVVGVAPGTAPGVYSFVYQICETAIPTNCATATATVTVIANPIDAVNDEVSGIVGATGGPAVLNAFTGDSVDGNVATTSNGQLSIAIGSTVPSELVFNAATGDVDVVAGTPAGTYSFDYTLCEVGNPSNCDTATVTVIVEAAIIMANTDSLPSVNGATGLPNAGNAFSNDTLNGATVNPADISTNVTMPATPLSPGALVPALNTSTGIVSVPSGTPAGTYMIEYRICETINSMNCSISTITIEVTASVVVATNDSETGIDGAAGQAGVLNAFTGDTINADAASPSNATLSVAPGETVPSELSFDLTTGAVDVLPGTPAGTYPFDYQICETLNPTNCQIATITIDVAPSVDLVITKTNTPGDNGDVDQASDTVTSGTNTTYTLTVTNNGPDAVTGAIVTDTPTSGLTCAPANSLTITGDGVPPGSFTIADLTGAGITLVTLGNGQSASISFDCQVN
tara:strand:+ start:16700 stop:19708 length:3009 start_codon:yes stop_codon:yes gene_type:complete